MMKAMSVALFAMFVLVGCGADYDSGNYDSGYDGGITDSDVSEYVGLQESWDDEDIETQANVCMAIDIDPSIARSTAIENNVDPDVAEAFFEEVCP
jgi:hypothetical protein